MERETLYKIIGIIVVVAMAGSMFAAALIYMPDSSSGDPTDVQENPTNTGSSFQYSITFDTNVVSELNSIRIVAETSSLNKNEIDLAIQKIDDVSKVSYSEFRKNGEGWIYFAQIDLKKSANIENIVNEIFELDYFFGMKDSMKRVSIATPKEQIELYNADLNITRNFKFDYVTTFAIASLTTKPGDVITVSGTITLQAQNVLGIDLMEQSNQTNATQYYSVEKEFVLESIGEEIFFQASVDENSETDYEAELKKIDENIQVFLMQGNIIGQTNISNKTQVENLLSGLENFTIKQAGLIFVDKLFVEELNEEVEFNQEIDVEINAGKIIGQKINTEIIVAVQRDSVEIYSAVEK